MLPAEILMVEHPASPTRATLTWMSGLELIIQTDADWPVDTRVRFAMTLQGQTAAGTAEIRAWHTEGPRAARCRVVRIAPEDAQRLREWQSSLHTEDAVPWLDDETTLTGTARRGRSALNDALKSRIRRLRQTRRA